MKRITYLIIALLIIFGITVTSHADLIDMEDGTIYDTDTQLTWLKDAGMGGKRTWVEAGTWADTLVFASFDNWRLPIAVPSPGGPNIITYSWTASEMAHIYYTELKNDPANLGPAPPLNPGPFTNLEQYGYWSGTAATGGQVWAFNFSGGGQNGGGPANLLGVWAVREGERSIPTPEPSLMVLLGISVMSLAGLKRWWKE